MKPTAAPSPQQTAAYQAMFDYFNAELFDNQLPPVILNFSRKARTYGFFAPQRWDNGSDTTHEISLNPAHLKNRAPAEVASTLAHEMAHLWQQEHGRPSRRGYHNHEWAAKMEAIGLVPSSTGAPGGAKVGTRVSHYIAEDGPFARAFARMPKAFWLPWQCQPEEERQGGAGGRPAPKRNKVKYTCPTCGANAWGKPGLAIACLECGVRFQGEDEREGESDEQRVAA